jgi:hypothetical protein
MVGMSEKDQRGATQPEVTFSLIEEFFDAGDATPTQSFVVNT